MDPERLQRYVTELKPPPIELVGEDANSPDTWKKRREYLQETWDSFADPLRREKGAEALEAYRALREFREGLEGRLKEIEEEARRHESQARYYALLGRLCREKLREHGPEEKVRAALPEEDLRQYEGQQHAGPEGRPTKGSSRILIDALGPSWHAEVSAAGRGADGAKMIASFNPSDKRLRKHGVDPEALLWRDPVRLDGRATWAEALERIEEQARPHEQHVRTGEVIRFRLSVVENVLYQFEVLGAPLEMTEEEAKKLTAAGKEKRYRYALTCIEALEDYEEREWTIEKHGDRADFERYIKLEFALGKESPSSGRAVVEGAIRLLREDLGEEYESFEEDFESALRRRTEKITEVAEAAGLSALPRKEGS